MLPGLLAEAAPGAARDRPEGVIDWRAVALCVGDGLGQKSPGQLVVALRQADGQLARRTRVQLGGSAGTGTAAPRRPRVFDSEQAVVEQFVEVELGDVSGNADALRGLIAVDRTGLGDNVSVQGPTCRIAECADPCDLGIELGRH